MLNWIDIPRGTSSLLGGLNGLKSVEVSQLICILAFLLLFHATHCRFGNILFYSSRPCSSEVAGTTRRLLRSLHCQNNRLRTPTDRQSTVTVWQKRDITVSVQPIICWWEKTAENDIFL
jgi:hypothetical protein